jgi:hypothetical protein
MDIDSLHRAFVLQAQAGAAMGAPFSMAVIETVAGELGNGGPYDALFAPWLSAGTRQAVADAAPLRILAGFHDLVLSGTEPELAALYPDRCAAPDPAVLAERLREVAVRRGAELAAFMASPPQTNEAGRSLCLFGGFLTVAAETGLPLRCLELGASAGLNQIWDRYRYDLGQGRAWGDPASPVRLAGEWTGAVPPLDAPVRVAERRACDQSPIDLADPVQARRLVAYVWAEQAERLARIRAAIGLAREAGVRVERADAGEWAEAHAHPRAGTATVLYHSVFWQYPPEETRARMAAAIEAAGRAATREAPFAWLRMEPDSGYVFEVALTIWPGGEPRRLALVHPHGASVTWC